MKKGFVVSAVLYPLLVIAIALIMSVIAMSDNRRKILDNLKLEVTEESETDPEMSNSTLYYKMLALEEAYAEMNARVSEERFEELEAKIKDSITKTKLESYPVGSLYISTTNKNPSTFIGGTWESYGEGRTLIGNGSNGTSEYQAGATGGTESHLHTGTVGNTILTTAQIPTHTHSIPSLSGKTSTNGNHAHKNKYAMKVASGTARATIAADSSSTSGSITEAGNHSHTVTTNASTTGSSGSGGAHNHSFTMTTTSHMPPYIVVYIWKRTK